MHKRVVIVSSLQIFPPESGGQLRTANLAKSFCQLGYIVEIVSLTGRKKDYLQGVESGDNQIATGLSEYVYRGRFFALLQFVSYRLKMAPFWVTFLAKSFLPKVIKQKIVQADYLVLDFPFLYPLAERNFILNTHNAEHELYEKESRQREWVRKIEVKAFDKAKQIFFCHTTDQEKFKGMVKDLDQKSSFIPNGIDLADFTPSQKTRAQVRENLNISEKDKVFLFTGSQYAPNVEAYHFLRDFADKFAQELQENNLVILVAGTVCKEIYHSQHLKVLGRVELMSDYFWASDFGINPVETGSGTNVKMIEFLAAQLPVLTSAFGARGLELADLEDAVYFERSSLLERMVFLAKMNREVASKMAQRALQKNMAKVEMKESLKELVLCS